MNKCGRHYRESGQGCQLGERRRTRQKGRALGRPFRGLEVHENDSGPSNGWWRVTVWLRQAGAPAEDPFRGEQRHKDYKRTGRMA